MHRVFDTLLIEFLSHEIEHFGICDQNFFEICQLLKFRFIGW